MPDGGAQPTSTRRPVLRFGPDGYLWLPDEVATEYPLTLYLNGEQWVTLLVSPDHLDELVVGFLASEGLIQGAGDMATCTFDLEGGRADVRLHTDVSARAAAVFKRPVITSCCGKGRLATSLVGDDGARPVETSLTLTSEGCLHVLEELFRASTLFRNTGGVHNACLATESEILAARCDIGRHNALDKLYGWSLKQGIPLHDKLVAFSGRISSEILLKVAKIGFGVVISKSAPTELALSLADTLNITVVGFVRSGSLNVYTHPHRLKIAEKHMA